MCIRDRAPADHRQVGAVRQAVQLAHLVDTEKLRLVDQHTGCLLYTSDAADEGSSVDLGGRRIIKKKINDKM